MLGQLPGWLVQKAKRHSVPKADRVAQCAAESGLIVAGLCPVSQQPKRLLLQSRFFHAWFPNFSPLRK